MQSRREGKRSSFDVHRGSKMLFGTYKQGGDTFPLSGKSLFFIGGAQWAHLLLISRTFSDRSEAAHSHTSGLSESQLLYKEHLYYSKGVQCITQWVHWHWQSPFWRENRKYTPPRLTNSTATCIFLHNPWQIWWIIWCRIMMPAASLFLLLALNRLNSNRHKERLVANNPWPQLLWIYAINSSPFQLALCEH